MKLLNLSCAQIAIAVSYCLICKYLIEILGARLTVELVKFADTHCHEQNLFLTLQVSKISSASAFPWERCWCIAIASEVFTALRYLAGD